MVPHQFPCFCHTFPTGERVKLRLRASSFFCLASSTSKHGALAGCFSLELRLKCNWLVVLTILKNICQWEGLSHILWKIKNV